MDTLDTRRILYWHCGVARSCRGIVSEVLFVRASRPHNLYQGRKPRSTKKRIRADPQPRARSGPISPRHRKARHLGSPSSSARSNLEGSRSPDRWTERQPLPVGGSRFSISDHPSGDHQRCAATVCAWVFLGSEVGSCCICTIVSSADVASPLRLDRPRVTQLSDKFR